MNNWKKINERHYVRDDGAVVKWDDNMTFINPINPKSKMWTVWEPDPGSGYLSVTRRGTVFTWRIRFKTPDAAMKACNKKWPYTG